MSRLVRDLLESLAQCVFTRFELLDVCLQILTHPLDTRECPLAGERGLRHIIVLGIQLLLVRLLTRAMVPSGLNRMSFATRTYWSRDVPSFPWKKYVKICTF